MDVFRSNLLSLDLKPAHFQISPKRLKKLHVRCEWGSETFAMVHTHHEDKKTASNSKLKGASQIPYFNLLSHIVYVCV